MTFFYLKPFLYNISVDAIEKTENYLLEYKVNLNIIRLILKTCPKIMRIIYSGNKVFVDYRKMKNRIKLGLQISDGLVTQEMLVH